MRPAYGKTEKWKEHTNDHQNYDPSLQKIQNNGSQSTQKAKFNPLCYAKIYMSSFIHHNNYENGESRQSML